MATKKFEMTEEDGMSFPLVRKAFDLFAPDSGLYVKKIFSSRMLLENEDFSVVIIPNRGQSTDSSKMED